MQQEYKTGTVEEVLEKSSFGDDFFSQSLRLIDGDGTEYFVKYGDEYQPLKSDQLKSSGDKVIIVQQENQSGELTSVIADSFRLPTVFVLSMLFVVIIAAIGKKKGLLSIVGMILSLLVLLKFVVPQILIGANPILISLIGSFVIGFVTVYLSHGFNLKSHIALFSMMTSLLAVSILSFFAVQSAALFGLGSEEAAFLQLGVTSSINLQGLLLGGIMLGALGVLDDITVSQTSIVFQLRMAKKTIGFKELYNRSIEVGRDHIASLVNTLVLAYVGANMPLLVLFTINESVPSWVMLNSEIIVEEVIRTLVGSMGLVLAVPFTTIIATYFAMKLKEKELRDLVHGERGHSH